MVSLYHTASGPQSHTSAQGCLTTKLTTSRASQDGLTHPTSCPSWARSQLWSAHSPV